MHLVFHLNGKEAHAMVGSADSDSGTDVIEVDFCAAVVIYDCDFVSRGFALAFSDQWVLSAQIIRRANRVPSPNDIATVWPLTQQYPVHPAHLSRKVPCIYRK